MPDYDLFEALLNTKKELEKTINLTTDEIKKEALEYFKKNKKQIFDIFIQNKTDQRQIWLTAGASGAGKTEFIKSLNHSENMNIVDTDEIRKLFPYYSGANADLFQKASIKAVEYLLDNCFKHNYSFVLDTNLASYDVANKNIQRAIKRGYTIEIYFVYSDYKRCKNLTKIREKNEKRQVPDDVFDAKAAGSLETFGKIIDRYGENPDIQATIIDLESDEVLTNNSPNKQQKKLDFYAKELGKYLNTTKHL